MNNFADSYNGGNDSKNQSDGVSVGGIKVDYVPPKENANNKETEGEYVDFEEINDKNI